MDVILHQLGGLILGSVPTMIMFVALVVAYGLLVRGPLDAVLAQRRALTKGAIEQAQGAMDAAEAETRVFEDKLRAARSEIFAARDQRLTRLKVERVQMLQQARDLTATRLEVARLEIERDAVSARERIESMSGELSAKILRAILPAGVTATEVPQ